MEPQAGELQHGFVEAGKDKMKFHLAVISIAELALIAALSGIGVYALVNSNIFSVVREFGEAHHYVFIYYLPVILWGLVFAYGMLNSILQGKGYGGFIWFVVVLSMPSLLSFNTVNWPGIFGSEYNLSTSLDFSEMLVLGVLVITGYIILNYFILFRQTRHNMISREVNPVDMESVTVYSYLALSLAVIAALAATMVVAFLSRNFELLVLDYIRNIPWNVVFIGLLCILLLAFYLYWLGARRRTKNQ